MSDENMVETWLDCEYRYNGFYAKGLKQFLPHRCRYKSLPSGLGSEECEPLLDSDKCYMGYKK